MITFTSQAGEQLKVWWKYHLDDQGRHNITECFLAKLTPSGKYGPWFAESKIARHSTDKDDKELARKLTLRKLLGKVFLLKSDRTAAWAAYNHRGQEHQHSCE